MIDFHNNYFQMDWNHLLVSYQSGSQPEFFLNGEKLTSDCQVSGSQDITTCKLAPQYGCAGSEGCAGDYIMIGENMRGAIDDLRIFNKSISLQ